MTLKLPLTLLLAGFVFTPLNAQDRFPETIPPSDLSVGLDNVAVIPDSAPNQPPRLSVLTEDPDGRLFVNDQRGPLYSFNEPDGSVQEYLDLRDYPELAIVSTSEAGFQSFAFHPDFHDAEAEGHGRLYTIHSCSNVSKNPDFDPGGSTSFHTLLLEWRVADSRADTFTPADQEKPYREILRLKQPFGNHNAGLIAFNPLAGPSHADRGRLYVAVGDGGSGGDPQENGEDASNPYGSILRIDPLGNDSANGQYGIVADNALASDGNSATLGEIFCYGLRNPQRFGWDIVTGNCYIADIGQNAVEEINLATNGADFGWDTREGSFPFEGNRTEGLTDPVAEYDHTNPVSNPPTTINNRAVTVGEVVRGACIPGLEGHLLLADFPTGLIFLLDVTTDPFDGGQDGLSELVPLDEDNNPVRFLELINQERERRGLPDQRRTDLRFSVNTPGRIFLTNKHDGIVRRIRPLTTPFLSAQNSAEGFELNWSGILQESADLGEWTDVLPQPVDGWFVPAGQQGAGFYRSVRK